MNSWQNREKITILVTDSGLGGLSVFAYLAAYLREKLFFKKVQLVFVNALARKDLGYNQLKTNQERVRIFDLALQGMTNFFKPDILFIACNTLSVLYDKTEFSRSAKIPVVGIIEVGTQALIAAFSDKTQDSAIIMGTPTTIRENRHHDILINNGIDPERIVLQACEMLESEIQDDPRSDVVKRMIKEFATEALTKLKPGSKGINVGLFCTHYGYSAALFKKTFNSLTELTINIIDPNIKMVQSVLKDMEEFRFRKTVLELRVISGPPISKTERETIGKLLDEISRDAGKAFRNYEHFSYFTI